MQINRINSNGNNFGAKLTPEVTRQLRGVLGDYLRNGDVDSYQKSLAHVRDLKTLVPNGQLVVEDFDICQYAPYCTPNIKPIITLRRPDYKDVRVYRGKLKSFDSICTLTENLKKAADDSVKYPKYDDFKIKDLLDDDLPIGG